MLRAILGRGSASAARCSGGAWPAGSEPRAVSRGSGGVALARPARSLVRFLYTSNPFYILSADLVFVGLRMSFGSGGPAARVLGAGDEPGGIHAAAGDDGLRPDPGRPALGRPAQLAAPGRDDVPGDRDELRRHHGGRTRARESLGYLGGLAFAVVVTEGVLHTIRLRLPGWYRAGLLRDPGLVFLYPVALVPLLGDPENPSLQWALFGFSPLAGLAVTSLVPAARRGRAVPREERQSLAMAAVSLVAVRRAGRRPVRPVLVALRLVPLRGGEPHDLRAVLPGADRAGGQPGLARDRDRLGPAGHHDRRVARPAGPGLPGDGRGSQDAVYRDFLEMFIQTLGGSPAYLTLIAATLFLAYAVVASRAAGLGADGHRPGRSGGGRPADDRSRRVWSHPRRCRWSAAGLVLAVAAWRRRDSRRAALAAGLPGRRDHPRRGRARARRRTLADRLHLGVASLMVVGALFDDGLGRLARRSRWRWLWLCSAWTRRPVTRGSGPRCRRSLIAWYPLLIAASAWCFSFLVRDRLYLAARRSAWPAGWHTPASGPTASSARSSSASTRSPGGCSSSWSPWRSA